MTELDKSAQYHDRDGGDFYQSPKGNNDFIRRHFRRYIAGTPIPTKGQYDETFKREYNSTPKRYGWFRRGIAWGSTAGVIITDWGFGTAGTILFKTANNLYHVGLLDKTRYKNIGNPSKWNSNPKESLNSSKFNFKAQSFNVNLLSALNRLNNWNKISKWRL